MVPVRSTSTRSRGRGRRRRCSRIWSSSCRTFWKRSTTAHGQERHVRGRGASARLAHGSRREVPRRSAIARNRPGAHPALAGRVSPRRGRRAAGDFARGHRRHVRRHRQRGGRAISRSRRSGATTSSAVRMPYRTSSADRCEHARLVTEALGIEERTVDISAAVDGYAAACGLPPTPRAARQRHGADAHG